MRPVWQARSVVLMHRSAASFAACVGVLALVLMPQALGLHGARYLLVVVPPLAVISILAWWALTRQGGRPQ